MVAFVDFGAGVAVFAVFPGPACVPLGMVFSGTLGAFDVLATVVAFVVVAGVAKKFLVLFPGHCVTFGVVLLGGMKWTSGITLNADAKSSIYTILTGFQIKPQSDWLKILKTSMSVGLVCDWCMYHIK